MEQYFELMKDVGCHLTRTLCQLPNFKYNLLFKVHTPITVVVLFAVLSIRECGIHPVSIRISEAWIVIIGITLIVFIIRDLRLLIGVILCKKVLIRNILNFQVYKLAVILLPCIKHSHGKVFFKTISQLI